MFPIDEILRPSSLHRFRRRRNVMWRGAKCSRHSFSSSSFRFGRTCNAFPPTPCEQPILFPEESVVFVEEVEKSSMHQCVCCLVNLIVCHWTVNTFCRNMRQPKSGQVSRHDSKIWLLSDIVELFRDEANLLWSQTCLPLWKHVLGAKIWECFPDWHWVCAWFVVCLSLDWDFWHVDGKIWFSGLRKRQFFNNLHVQIALLQIRHPVKIFPPPRPLHEILLNLFAL